MLNSKNLENVKRNVNKISESNSQKMAVALANITLLNLKAELLDNELLTSDISKLLDVWTENITV